MSECIIGATTKSGLLVFLNFPKEASHFGNFGLCSQQQLRSENVFFYHGYNQSSFQNL